MDKSKKAMFVKKMGKKRLKLTKKPIEHFDGGGIAGLLGSAGGAGGTGFSTPSGTTGAQINQAYDQGQTALGGQQALADTLAPQAQQAVNAENVLSGQYAQQALGAGPNVAVNELNQATGANVANQAALMAGQRGAGANPALLARQAAMQGAALQQKAAGQSATMQAQQQIAAEQAQAGLANNQIAQTQGATTANTQAHQNEQNILQGANTANNNIQGQLANTTMQGQQGMLGGIMNAAGAAIGLSEGGEVKTHGLDFVHKMTKMGLDHHSKQNFAEGGSVPAPSPAKSAQDSMRDAFHFAEGGDIQTPAVAVYQTPQANFPTIQQEQGGFTPGANAGAQAMGNSMKGSPKPEKKPGDTSAPTDMAITGQNNPLVQSNQADTMAPMAGGMGDEGGGLPSSLTSLKAYKGGEMHPHFQGKHKSHIANYLLNKGGPVPAMVSAGEVYLSPDQVHKVIHEDADPVKIGHKFGGKAKVKGDSKKNDTIPATLEEGGVVVDRENMGSAEKRKLFVHRAIAKRKAGSR